MFMGFLSTFKMTGPKRNSEFCFPRFVLGIIEVEGEQNSLFPAGPAIQFFVTPPKSKVGKTAKKSFALLRLAHKVAAVSTSTT